MKREKGYLVFSFHDGDEITAMFVSDDKDGKSFFEKISKAKSNREAIDILNERDYLFEKEETKPLCWYSFKKDWPFNEKEIIGTCYLMVY